MAAREDSLPGSHRGNLTADDAAFADIWGGKVGLQIIYGNRESAHALVDQAFTARSVVNSPPILSVPLAELGFDYRTCNALEKYHEIGTVGELLESDIPRLLGTPNIGTNMILGLLQTLAAQSVKRAIQLEDELKRRQ